MINASLVAPSLSKLQVLGFLVLMDQMLNPWLQVPNRGKALAGWTRPSIDELGVPTEAWSKVKTNILIFFLVGDYLSSDAMMPRHVLEGVFSSLNFSSSFLLFLITLKNTEYKIEQQKVKA